MQGLRFTMNPSRNEKLVGNRTDVSFYATYRAVGYTCPTTCTLLNAGCYAQGGNVALQMRGRYGMDDGAIHHAAVMALPRGAFVRLHVSGDVMLPADGNGSDTVDTAYLSAIVNAAHARPDVTFYGYTHAWRMVDRAAFVWPVNLTLNASCDTSEDVRAARAAGWQTTTVVASDTSYRRSGDTVVCPNQTVGLSCYDCKLCMRSRPMTVAFKAHGSGTRKVDRGLALPMA
jgi:hypothetical protein